MSFGPSIEQGGDLVGNNSLPPNTLMHVLVRPRKSAVTDTSGKPLMGGLRTNPLDGCFVYSELNGLISTT